MSSEFSKLLKTAKKLGLTSMVWTADRQTKKPQVAVAAWPHFVVADTEIDALVELIRKIKESQTTQREAPPL